MTHKRPRMVRRFRGRSLSAGSTVYRPHPQGCSSRRPSRTATNQIRTRHRSQDGEGAQTNYSALASPARRRGDRVNLVTVHPFAAHAHVSGPGLGAPLRCNIGRNVSRTCRSQPSWLPLRNIARFAARAHGLVSRSAMEQREESAAGCARRPRSVSHR